MKNILKNLRENWISYAFETLVVIVGILIAFSLNNWSENWKNNDLKEMYLENLREELSEEIKSFESRLDEINSKNDNIKKVIKSLQTNRDSLDENELNISLMRIFAEGARRPYNSVYKDLIATGKLSLIDHSTRKLILDYYNQNEFYSAHMEQEYKYNWEELLPFFNRSGIFKWEISLNQMFGEESTTMETPNFHLLDLKQNDPTFIEAKNGILFKRVMLWNNEKETKRMLEKSKTLLNAINHEKNP